MLAPECRGTCIELCSRRQRVHHSQAFARSLDWGNVNNAEFSGIACRWPDQQEAVSDWLKSVDGLKDERLHMYACRIRRMVRSCC